MMIAGNPHIENDKKPKRKEDLMKLSMDKKEEIKVRRKKGPSQADLLAFQMLNFNKK